MDLYDVAVARKLSSGGGGGSSDFSTAEVTFTSTSGMYALFGYAVEEGTPVTLTFPLFDINMQGMKAYFIPVSMVTGSSSAPTVSGGLIVYGNDLMITGDGTFTCAGS